jgi:hypothetical protein
VISPRSPLSRSTEPHMSTASPGHSVLTASFAARGSRVQIPSAPPNTLVRAVAGRAIACCLGLFRVRRRTVAPQDRFLKHLISCEGVTWVEVCDMKPRVSSVRLATTIPDIIWSCHRRCSQRLAGVTSFDYSQPSQADQDVPWPIFRASSTSSKPCRPQFWLQSRHRGSPGSSIEHLSELKNARVSIFRDQRLCAR